MEIDTTIAFDDMPLGLTYETAAVFVELLAGIKSFNFLYLPVDPHNFVPQRRLIVNFVSHEIALVAIDQASNFMRISVSWYHTQGLSDNINAFRESAHPDSPIELCPHIFSTCNSKQPVQPVVQAGEKRRGATSTVKIFIGGLGLETDSASLRNYCSQFGKIEDCAVVQDFTGVSRRFGFCKFASAEAATKCLVKNNHQIDGCRAGVRPYTNQE